MSDTPTNGLQSFGTLTKVVMVLIKLWAQVYGTFTYITL